MLSDIRYQNGKLEYKVRLLEKKIKSINEKLNQRNIQIEKIHDRIFWVSQQVIEDQIETN